MNKLDVTELQNRPTNFNSLKPDVDKQDTDKLKTVSIFLRKVRDLVKKLDSEKNGQNKKHFIMY